MRARARHIAMVRRGRSEVVRRVGVLGCIERGWIKSVLLGLALR